MEEHRPHIGEKEIRGGLSIEHQDMTTLWLISVWSAFCHQGPKLLENWTQREKTWVRYIGIHKASHRKKEVQSHISHHLCKSKHNILRVWISYHYLIFYYSNLALALCTFLSYLILVLVSNIELGFTLGNGSWFKLSK